MTFQLDLATTARLAAWRRRPFGKIMPRTHPQCCALDNQSEDASRSQEYDGCVFRHAEGRGHFPIRVEFGKDSGVFAEVLLQGFDSGLK